MTPEEIADAQEARAVIEHAARMEAHADRRAEHIAYMDWLADSRAATAAAAMRSERYVASQEAIAAELPRSQRLAILVDSATARITDRTSATGAVDVPRGVTEARAILAEIERQTVPPAPPVPPVPPPGGV